MLCRNPLNSWESLCPCFFLIIYYLYDREPGIPETFNVPVLILLFGVFLSMFGALAFHEQSMSMTLWGERFIFFYIFYFLLSKLRIEPDYIIKFCLVLGFAFSIFYIVQYAIYPRAIVSAKMFNDRGTLRIFMPGSGYLVIGYFIALYSFFKNYKIIYLVYLILALIVYILLGTRQVLASVVLVTVLFLFQSKVVRLKAILIPLMVVSIIPFYFLFQNIFDSMLDVTSHQSSNIEGDIRFRAMKFFLFEFFPNTISYITGNGMYGGDTAYARQVLSYSDVYGFFMSDLGLIGDYVKFGVFFVLGVIIIFIKAFTAKLPEKYMFVKYNFYIMLMTLFTGGSAFAEDSNIVILGLFMYLIDYNKMEKKKASQAKKEETSRRQVNEKEAVYPASL